ncbi:MAG: putative O-methyltransferase [Proteobacteria bacterium]|nr:putative O-methyltransferase [Pseudomonadota bacterium]
MPSLTFFKYLVCEAFSRSVTPREPEPAMLMDDPAQVAAFARAGREDGVIGQIYLLNSIQLCELIRPGDHVIDLACGPATQLVQVARLNPHADFLGIDLAPRMLADARAHVASQGLGNVRFALGDITQLTDLPDASADLVMSTFSLHHLPDLAALTRCFGEIRRILKPGGRVYLSDFGRLKRPQTMHFMAHRNAREQGPLFTTDYHNSMRAAFSVAELRAALPALGPGFLLTPSPLAAFMVIIRSPMQHPLSDLARTGLKALWQALPAAQQDDFDELWRCFRMKRLAIPAVHK